MIQAFLRLLAFGVVVFGMVGCSSNKDESSIKGLTEDDAAKLNARGGAWDAEDAPITAQTHVAAGQLAESQGDLSRAIEQYRKALEIDSRMSIAVYRLGIVYSAMRSYDDAIQAWQTYSRMTNGSPESFSNLGFCYELKGDRESAQNVYQQGLAKFPKHQGLRVNYGMMLARGGDVEGGRKQLGEVLSAAQVHYNIGSMYELQGRKELARQEYIASIQADPNFIDARSRLATLDQN
jgi:tetratricopeptide (TPR) repeat protein